MMKSHNRTSRSPEETYGKLVVTIFHCLYRTNPKWKKKMGSEKSSLPLITRHFTDVNSSHPNFVSSVQEFSGDVLTPTEPKHA